ncbi:hypothetical protein CMQ_4033 [Grosmannia clavigera kw1407]|uniref:Protein HRI1 n=1 Tax=Grosmannia clavigera (strain kw1407 / UAMH 11150) TaxID=655863 RepID=F0X9S5_GROCL|nr:uncharacterized protein CMQ_4033 [Grosmannia clavigera kw1407]EFX05964.1 hypothetical protein CMQ_4033 [Grosmannia clavigera kw1407]
MTIRLSTRISIRWGDDSPSEPTTTLVMSVDGYFMDLRVNKSDDSVDWAFAGRREIVSQDPLHCRWHHIIDSRHIFDPDEGEFENLSNGDSLETGSMSCPEKGGVVTPYEEVWRSIQPTAGLERGWILQREEDDGSKTITFLGRVGSVFFAMKQQPPSGHLTVRREELQTAEAGSDKAPQWVTKYHSGNATLPSLANAGLLNFPDELTWKVGDEVTIQGQLYTVRAQHS